MKRFRSVGSDKCSMLLTDFKADAQSCGNTGVFREGSITEERRNLHSHEVDNSDRSCIEYDSMM